MDPAECAIGKASEGLRFKSATTAAWDGYEAVEAEHRPVAIMALEHLVPSPATVTVHHPPASVTR